MVGIRNKTLYLQREPVLASDIDPGHAVKAIPGEGLTRTKTGRNDDK